MQTLKNYIAENYKSLAEFARLQGISRQQLHQQAKNDSFVVVDDVVLQIKYKITQKHP